MTLISFLHIPVLRNKGITVQTISVFVRGASWLNQILSSNITYVSAGSTYSTSKILGMFPHPAHRNFKVLRDLRYLRHCSCLSPVVKRHVPEEERIKQKLQLQFWYLGNKYALSSSSWIALESPASRQLADRLFVDFIFEKRFIYWITHGINSQFQFLKVSFYFPINYGICNIETLLFVNNTRDNIRPHKRVFRNCYSL